MREIALVDKEGVDTEYSKALGYYKVLSDGNADITVITNYPYKMLYQVKKGETIKQINARGYKVLSDFVSEGDTVVLEKTNTSTYVVQPLESLESICQKFKVSRGEILEKNNLKSDKVFIGQILNI